MDKTILSQYSQMVREAADLRKRIVKIKSIMDGYEFVSDRVSTGRRSSHSLGGVRVSGTNNRNYSARKTEYLRLILLYESLEDKLVKATADVEEYIQTIDDSRIRQIMRIRYTAGSDGKLNSWIHVALEMHETEDSCRKAHDRYLKNESLQASPTFG